MDLAKGARDPSLLLLLFSNIVAIICAIVFKWSIMNVLWLYWFQSVIIGIFTALKILTAKIKEEDKSKEIKPFEQVFGNSFGNAASFKFSVGEAGTGLFSKASLGIFFCFHYGFFHLIYAIFLGVLPSMVTGGFGGASAGAALRQANFSGILPIVGLFFVTHAFSYYYNYILRNEREMGSSGLQKLFFEPYARIVPMHITIIAGGFLISMASGAVETVLLVFFLALKTIFDLAMHTRGHSKLKRALFNSPV